MKRVPACDLKSCQRIGEHAAILCVNEFLSCPLPDSTIQIRTKRMLHVSHVQWGAQENSHCNRRPQSVADALINAPADHSSCRKFLRNQRDVRLQEKDCSGGWGIEGTKRKRLELELRRMDRDGSGGARGGVRACVPNP